MRAGPFLSMHLACVSVFFVETTTTALLLCAVLYVVRMFGITGGYHRYFSHRSYKTSRWFQFCLAWLGCSAMQKGPLWWAAHHRHHHKYSDTEEDTHSPITRTIWWSHVGWILSPKYQQYNPEAIKDFAKYPELRWLDRNHWIPGLCLAGLCYAIDGFSGIAWGFFVSTVLLYHGTFLVNSACHLFGSRRYNTTDQSRNNALVAILTLGEGWHNNHHKYQSSTNQGFYWWEIDIAYYTLRVLGLFGLVWGFRLPPLEKLATHDGPVATLPEQEIAATTVPPIAVELAPASLPSPNTLA